MSATLVMGAHKNLPLLFLHASSAGPCLASATGEILCVIKLPCRSPLSLPDCCRLVDCDGFLLPVSFEQKTRLPPPSCIPCPSLGGCCTPVFHGVLTARGTISLQCHLSQSGSSSYQGPCGPSNLTSAPMKIFPLPKPRSLQHILAKKAQCVSINSH